MARDAGLRRPPSFLTIQESASDMSHKILLQPRRSNMRLAWAVAGGLGAILALSLGHFPVSPDAASVPDAAPANSAAHAQQDLVRTFVGTTPDGAIDARGDALILSPALIQRFEYHLTAVGERSIAAIRSAILQDINRELTPAAQKEAARILEAYLQFKTALGSARQPKLGTIHSASLAQHFQAIRQTRALYFTPAEVAALFGDVDSYDDYMVRKLAIVQNNQLTAAEKSHQLQALQQTLSPQQRAHIEEPVAHLTLASQVEAARQAGASDHQIERIRTQAVGAEAAQRLAALDQEEAAWKERIRQYHEARAQHPGEQQRIRDNLFTPQEQLRLAAYE